MFSTQALSPAGIGDREALHARMMDDWQAVKMSVDKPDLVPIIGASLLLSIETGETGAAAKESGWFGRMSSTLPCFG